MTQTTDGPTLDQGVGPTAARDLAGDLANMQQQIVELLARLDRPPSNVSIRAGEVFVDIAWSSPAPVHAPVQAPPPVPAAVPQPAGGSDVQAPAAEPRPGPAAAHLTSPGVGVFYHAKEPGAEPFVTVGTVVRPGQQIGIIEAMKLMMPVEADKAGRITAVLKGNGEAVEYDEALFALDTDASGE
jgi:acetyl-CoA carboxylase biotin carboxyl carrier protein